MRLPLKGDETLPGGAWVPSQECGESSQAWEKRYQGGDKMRTLRWFHVYGDDPCNFAMEKCVVHQILC